MSRIKLNISSVAEETGALLKSYLEDRGLTIDPRAESTICYGLGTRSRRALNSACNDGDKIDRMKLMNAAGVLTVPWFDGEQVPRDFKFPALARQTYGHGGTDIVPVFQAEEIPWRVRAGWTWFSAYVPLETEYRVWVFRDTHLDTYEKTMQRPDDYKFVGRNFRNGFDFTHYNRPPIEAVDAAKKTIKSLGFDFGAVDMLLGKDGKVYVLECNTAPGVIKSGAQSTLAKLADCMVNWATT